MRGRTVRTKAKRRFIDEIASGKSVTAACAAAGIGRSSVYDMRCDDADFAAAWDDAEEQSVDLLEDEARRRALTPCLPGSAPLLMFLLRHRRPSVYRPPPASAAVVAMTAEDVADLEKARRLRSMTSAEIEAELEAIEAKRRFADEARQEVFARRQGNGAADQ